MKNDEQLQGAEMKGIQLYSSCIKRNFDGLMNDLNYTNLKFNGKRQKIYVVAKLRKLYYHYIKFFLYVCRSKQTFKTPTMHHSP